VPHLNVARLVVALQSLTSPFEFLTFRNSKLNFLTMLKSLAFYIPIAADIIGIIVALYFIITDAARQSSSNNGPLTLVTLLMCGWVALCFYLRSTKTPALGTVLAWIPAIPLILYGIFILLFIIINPDMR
jgi:hypothetical protein